MIGFLVALGIITSFGILVVLSLKWYRFMGDELEAAGKPRWYQVFFGPDAIGLLGLWWARRERMKNRRHLR